MNQDQKLPEGFAAPTALPEEAQKQSAWQKQNRAWWENNPMRYDWNDKLGAAEFSREFYEEIDRRFFFDASRYLPPKDRPFDALIPFPKLPGCDVLEIGVGNGSHAQLIAPHCKSYTGIDLTEYAVKSTGTRFQVFGVPGRVMQMDAEKMELPDASFDFIWTWGVIHHSANTGQILAEMNRVLRPGGCATIMVYHWSFLYVWIFTALFRGILLGGFFRGRSLHELIQLHTDGAIARFYKPSEWKALVESRGFVLDEQRILGQKSEIFPLPASRFKDALMRITPNAFARFITNTCRQGSFLVTTIRKP
jgi:ubiquinone/menaquinone biosynthesis C-methylase UbiE